MVAVVDFSIPLELDDLRQRVGAFVGDEVLPAEAQVTEQTFDEVLAGLRKKARDDGLWTPHLPAEWGRARGGPPGDGPRLRGVRGRREYHPLAPARATPRRVRSADPPG
jgi:alkylation response protein AidB-like acyl-CoA dehydrogenase